MPPGETPFDGGMNMSVRHLPFFGWGREGAESLLAGTLFIGTCHGGGMREAASQYKSVSKNMSKKMIIR